MIIHADQSAHHTPINPPATTPRLHTPNVHVYRPTGGPVLATLYRGWHDVPTLTNWLIRLRGYPGVPGDAKCIGPGPAGSVLLVHRKVDHLAPNTYLIYNDRRLFQAQPDEFPYLRATGLPE